MTALVLLVVSALDVQLGLPTFIAGVATTLGVCALAKRSPFELARNVSWSVLPLVAGLFVLVEALDRTGVIAQVAQAIRTASSDPVQGAAASGTILAFVSNVMNNLPAGLIASTAVAQAHPPRRVVDALLIGVSAEKRVRRPCRVTPTGPTALRRAMQFLARSRHGSVATRSLYSADYLRTGIACSNTAIAFIAD